SAGEIAAWRVRWIALPVVVTILWTGTRMLRSIKQNPDRFNGLRAARLGITAAAVVTILIATLISVTIPERFRQRQYAIEAGQNARLYTIHRALMQYSEVHGTLPPQEDLIKALSALPDPDGLIAEALRGLDANSYEPTVTLATKSKPQILRGSALRNAPATGRSIEQPVTFNTYKLRLPSEHRLFSSDEDLIMEDGL